MIGFMNRKYTWRPMDKEMNRAYYGGFWIRLGAQLVDTLLSIPILIMVEHLNKFGTPNTYIATLILVQVFFLLCYIYFPVVHGGTPGKLLLNLRIVKLNGQPVGWRASLLRYSLALGLSLFQVALYAYCIKKGDYEVFSNLHWYEHGHYLGVFSPLLYKSFLCADYLWMITAVISIVIDKKRRAIHDFIAGTVVVKTAYLGLIKENVEPSNSEIIFRQE